MVTSACALLSLPLGSGVVLVTVAVLVNVPTVVGGLEAVIVNDAVPGGRVAVVQVTVGAVVPGTIELQDQPSGTTSDWNMIGDGRGKVSVAFAASAGPSLLTLTT
jgi:hypothetical protein